MQIAKDTYDLIIKKCPLAPPETGGILGGKDSIVNMCEFDKPDENCLNNSYQPNVSYLNYIIQQWMKNGFEFYGVFHSHISGENALSMPDKGYILRIMEAMPLELSKLYFPIVFPRESMLVYIATRENNAIQIEEDMIALID